jgi:hypothetical protein
MTQGIWPTETAMTLYKVVCPECGARQSVPVIPILEYGCGGALATGLHEAVGSGEAQCNPQLCSACDTILALPTEVMDDRTSQVFQTWFGH